MPSTNQQQGVSRRRTLRQQAALVLAAGLCITAAIAIWALLRGRLDSTEVQVLGSTLAASLFTLTGLVGGTVLDRTDLRRALGQITILLSAIDLVLAVVMIWSHPQSRSLDRVFGVTIVLLPAAVHGCLMLGRLRPGERSTVHALTWAAVGFATSAALLVAGGIAIATGPVSPVFWRLLGVLVILAILATLLTPIGRRISRNRDRDATGPANHGTSVPPPGHEPPRPTLMVGRLAADS